MNKSNNLVPDKVIGSKGGPVKRIFTQRDAIIYALGIGFSQDPLKEEDYDFTIESSEKFSVFPTYISCISYLDPFLTLSACEGMPQFNPFMFLHGEERIEFFKPLQAGVTYETAGYVNNVIDKGSFGLVSFKKQIKDEKGQLAGIITSTLAIKGIGGFGYKGNGSTQKIPSKPKRAADIILDAKSFPSQAFIYRMSGDLNLLHVLPSISSIQKFDKPIIHGLASLGIVARTIVQQLFSNDPNQLKLYHVRFVGHVFPGQSYKISIWKQQGYYWLSALVVERNKQCLIGYIVPRQNAKL